MSSSPAGQEDQDLNLQSANPVSTSQQLESPLPLVNRVPSPGNSFRSKCSISSDRNTAAMVALENAFDVNKNVKSSPPSIEQEDAACKPGSEISSNACEMAPSDSNARPSSSPETNARPSSIAPPSSIGSSVSMSNGDQEMDEPRDRPASGESSSDIPPANEFGESEAVKMVPKCQLCGVVETSVDALSAHIRTTHGDITAIIGEEVALRPMQPLRPAETRTKRNKIHRCKQCNFESPTKELHWKHCSTHIREDKRLHCPKCEFVTEYKHHLEYHVRNHYGSKPFHCTKCSYSCVNKSMLNSHMKSHSDKFLYYCNNCNYHSKYCHSMKQHTDKYNHTSTAPLAVAGGPSATPAKKDDKSPTEESNFGRRPRGHPKTKNEMSLSSHQLSKKTPMSMDSPTGLMPPKLSPSGPVTGPNPLLLSSFWPLNSMQQAQSSSAAAAAAYFNPVRRSGVPDIFTQNSGVGMEWPKNHGPLTGMVFNSASGVPTVPPPPSYVSSHTPSQMAMLNGINTTVSTLLGTTGTTSLAYTKPIGTSAAVFSPSASVSQMSPLMGFPGSQQVSNVPSVLQRLSAENEPATSLPLDLTTVRTCEEDADLISGRRRSRKGKAYRLDPQAIAMVTDDDYSSYGNRPASSSPVSPKSIISQRPGPGLPLRREPYPIASSATALGPSRNAWPLNASDDNSSPAFSPEGGASCAPGMPMNCNKGASDSSEGGDNSKVPKDAYSCGYCEIQFKDCVMYTMHMGYHGYQNPFKCNMCGVECDNKLAFFLHIARSAHP